MSAQLENYTSSLTNRGLVSFWSEHAALRPPSPSVSCQSWPRNTWEKLQKRAARTGRPTPTAKPRAQSPHRSPEGRPHRRTQGANTEPQGPPHKHNTSTHKHQHAHPHTPRQREPGQEPLKGENPKKNNDVNKGETADSRRSPKTRGVLYATFRRGQNRAQRSVADGIKPATGRRGRPPRKCSPCSRRLEEGSTDPAGAVSSPSFCLSGKCRSLVRARLESLTWLLSETIPGRTDDGHHTQEPRPGDPCVEVPGAPVLRLRRGAVLLTTLVLLLGA